MNQVILVGRFTKEPELKYTKDGKGYCNFSLAVSREFKKDEVDFINCVAWDKRAETIEKYVKKGHKFGVIGRIQIDKKDNAYYTKVIVEKIYFLESNKNEASTTQNQKQTEDDDDFPF